MTKCNMTHRPPIWRHLDPFTSYRNNRICLTVIEFCNKGLTKNEYLVNIHAVQENFFQENQKPQTCMAGDLKVV
jgi:hypothetical protein